MLGIHRSLGNIQLSSILTGGKSYDQISAYQLAHHLERCDVLTANGQAFTHLCFTRLLTQRGHRKRADRVLGYEAIVVSPGNSKSCSEFYRVPAFGGLTIKTVMCLDETGSKMVLEPMSLVLGEPDASSLETPKELPVDYEHFKQTHP